MRRLRRPDSLEAQTIGEHTRKIGTLQHFRWLRGIVAAVLVLNLLDAVFTIIVVSAVAGVMNAIAGGGTLLTFPALVGLGIPESNAQAYEKILRSGGVAIGVVPRSDDEASEIKDEFQRLEGENICYG